MRLYYARISHSSSAPQAGAFSYRFFIGALGLDIISFISRKETLHKVAITLYVMAALITPLVVWSGLEEAERLHLHHPVLDLHRRLALLTMWGSLASLPVLWFIQRKARKMFRIAFIVCAITIVTFVTIAGHNGGRMVYEYGVGVE